jgi:hypothetical protein
LKRALLALVVIVSCASPPPPSPRPASEQKASEATPAAAPAAASRSDSEAASTPAAGAKEWFMAPTASCGHGKGTLEDPWCIQDALGNGKVKPGDTIYGRLGANYTLTQMVGLYTSVKSTLNGTPERRITVRPYPPDQKTPTSLIRIACDQGEQKKPAFCVAIESNWVDYYDFEVAYFGDPRRHAVVNQWDLPGFGGGVQINANRKRSDGRGNRLINWVIHDTANNAFKADIANPVEFYGIVSYNYGFLYETGKIRRVGGHGFYLRNGQEASGRFRGCNSGVDDADPGVSSMVDNIVSAAIRVPGFAAESLAYQDYGTCACSMHRNEVFDGNFFLGGTLSGGCSATNNATLGTRDQRLTNNWWSSYRVGYYAAGCEGVTVDRNFIFRPMYAPSDKYYAKRQPMYVMQQRGKHVNPCRKGITFTNNVYWGNANAVEGEGKSDDEANGFKASWFPGGGNVYLPNDATPSQNYTAVRKNQFRPGSCNVYVANFLNLDEVAVSLTDCGLADGARFEVRSIYDYMGAPVKTGTYSASSPSVSFPMTTAANPISNSVGHLTDGAPGSYPDMHYSLTKDGGNIFRNAFVVLTTSPAPSASNAAPSPGRSSPAAR